MHPYVDWIALWRELVEMQSWSSHWVRAPDEPVDAWRTRARVFDVRVRRRWSQGSDSTRNFIVAQVDRGSTVLDIGAGTGAWATLLARHALKVTAIESSPSMAEVMRENIEAEGLTNVEVIQESWPEVPVEPHDISLCSHAMYGNADWPAFIRSMEAATRRGCFLVMRMPTIDGVMSIASRRVKGHPHDSPNGIVAYNALIQMGLFPNILMEDTSLWDPWTSKSREEAVSRIKYKLGLSEGPGEHDAFFAELVDRSLIPEADHYVWPRGVCSALIYWSPNR